MRLFAALAAIAASIVAAWIASNVSGLSTPPAVEIISVKSNGSQVLAPSSSASVSADGRYVAFASDSGILVPNDMNNVRDVFVRDRTAGTTERVSVSSSGAEGHGASAAPDEGPPRISSDGRYVAFASDAPDLVANDGNGMTDVFVRDRVAGTTERVSVATGGAEAHGPSVTPAISGDGRYVTYTSLAEDMVPNDDNFDRDVFLHDRMTGDTEAVSVSSDEVLGNLSSGGLGAGPARISADGRYVVFGSFADNLVPNDMNDFDDVFVRDRTAGTTERVSIATNGTEGNGHSVYGSISNDGRYVVFTSPANTLVTPEGFAGYDIFLRDRQTNTTTRLSDGPGGTPSNGDSFFAVISGDGTHVTYHSDASNLVTGDANSTTDVFLQDRATGAIERVSAPTGGATGGGVFPDINGNGTVVAFESLEEDVVSTDHNFDRDVFAWGKPLRVIPTPPTPTRTATPPQPLAGDVDCSGDRSSIDAALILQFGAGLLGALPCPSAADVNGDGDIDAIDAALVLQFVAGLLDDLP